MKKRLFCLALSVLLVVGMFSACSSGIDKSQASYALVTKAAGNAYNQ